MSEKRNVKCDPSRFEKGELLVSEEELEAFSLRLKAVSNKTRLKVILLLKNYKELCVCEFEQALKMKQSKVSYHLQLLVDAGLITRRIEGPNSYYRLNEGEVGDILSIAGIKAGGTS